MRDSKQIDNFQAKNRIFKILYFFKFIYGII